MKQERPGRGGRPFGTCLGKNKNRKYVSKIFEKSWDNVRGRPSRPMCGMAVHVVGCSKICNVRPAIYYCLALRPKTKLSIENVRQKTDPQNGKALDSTKTASTKLERKLHMAFGDRFNNQKVPLAGWSW